MIKKNGSMISTNTINGAVIPPEAEVFAADPEPFFRQEVDQLAVAFAQPPDICHERHVRLDASSLLLRLEDLAGDGAGDSLRTNPLHVQVGVLDGPLLILPLVFDHDHLGVGIRVGRAQRDQPLQLRHRQVDLVGGTDQRSGKQDHQDQADDEPDRSTARRRGSLLVRTTLHILAIVVHRWLSIPRLSVGSFLIPNLGSPDQ